MKKIILTSIAALCMACPSYATTLTGSGNECNEPILNTDTGPAELRAIWGANTINLEWYSDNTLLDVQQSADTCLYDGAITLPSTNPTKTGYTFGGWQVREAVAQLFNLATLNANTNGLSNASHGATDYCYYYYYNESTEEEVEVDDDCSDSHVSGLSAGEWKTEFSYGTVRGIARCSSTSGTWATAGTPSETTGRYCWCQPTGFAEPNSSSYMSVASPSWVFDYVDGSADGCAYYCADYCASRVLYYSDFRRAMYGISQ